MIGVLKMFHKRLKELMKEKDISQLELSQMTHISKSGISQYLSGKVMPSAAYLEAIAKALDVPISALTETEYEDTVKNVPVKIAASRLGISQDMLRTALQQQRVLFGFAVELGGDKWSYHISPSGLDNYLASEARL